MSRERPDSKIIPRNLLDKTAGTKETTTADLSRYGLQSDEQVIQFLKSQAGVNALGEIVRQLSIEEEQKDSQRIAQMERQIDFRRLIAFLILWFERVEASADQHTKLQISALNEKAIQAAKESALAGSPKVQSSVSEGLTRYESSITKSIADLENAIQTNEKEREILEHKKEALTQQKVSLDEKYNLFEGIFENEVFEQIIAKYASSDTRSLSEKDTEAFITSLRINEDDHQQITTGIAQLAAIMESMADKLNETIEQNEDPSLLINELNSINLRVAHLKDKQEVLNGTKYYAGDNGEEVTNPKDAKFILNSRVEKPNGEELTAKQKIVKDGDKYYLLKAGENLTLENKAEAQKNYEKIKDKILVVKEVVKDNRALENKVHADRVNDNTEQLKSNGQEKLKLNEQLVIQKVMLQKTKELTSQAPASTPMTPSSVSSPNPRPSFNITQSQLPTQGQQLQILLNKPQVTYNEVLNFAKNSTPDISTLISSNLPSVIENSEPIPQATLESLQINVAAYNLNPNMLNQLIPLNNDPKSRFKPGNERTNFKPGEETNTPNTADVPRPSLKS